MKLKIIFIISVLACIVYAEENIVYNLEIDYAYGELTQKDISLIYPVGYEQPGYT